MSGVQRFAAPDVAVAASATVGEGPVFDHRSGRLCWVDILEGTLMETDLATGEQRTSRFGTLLGAAVPRERAEGFAVAVADGFGLWAGGELQIVDPVLPEPQRRMNDAKCDSRGRLWAGSTHVDFEPGGGALHRWGGAGASVQIAAGFTLPNGIGWSPDDTTMFLADSEKHHVLAARFHPDAGDVEAFSPLFEVADGVPDGLAVDADGCLWVAIWGGSEVRRYSRAGELVGVVPMPVSQPSSCAFGDDGTLYITSARSGLDAAELARQPHAGSVFALPTTTSGVPVHAFAG